MEDKTRRKGGRKKKEEAERHSVTIAGKATPEQSKKIKMLAAKCGMTPSDYIIQRALNHQPKQRLSEDELAACRILEEGMANCRGVKNALRGTNEETKLQLFQSAQFMAAWIAEVDATVKILKDYLVKVKSIKY